MGSRNVINKYQENLVKQNFNGSDESEDDDELLELLEEEEENGHLQKYRESRMQEIASQMKDIRRNVESEGYGRVETLLNEQSVLQLTTSNKYVVLHFFHKDFKKCSIMDSKLSILAEKHLQTKFLRIDVEDAPFLVTKLSVKVLPVVILYINGIESNRLIGFEKLNFQPNQEDFDINSLENFLYANGEYFKHYWYY